MHIPGMESEHKKFETAADSVGTWSDGEKLVSGMSQVEVSKWVLKRISGFSKFLGVSYDGFEERTMQLFLDIEEKWRKGAMSDSKKSGRKNRKGVRELKRLHCSANYDGWKEVGESGCEGVGLIFYLLMKIKILNWNVRGLNVKEKRVVVKSLLKGWKADVVCLQETKLNEMSMMIVKELWGSPG